MNMNYYQYMSSRTIPEDSLGREDKINFAFGLCGESGEVVDLIKKTLFHDHPIPKDKLSEELGDVLWYITALATSYDIQLDDIANSNLKKLKKRYPKGFTFLDSINRD